MPNLIETLSFTQNENYVQIINMVPSKLQKKKNMPLKKKKAPFLRIYEKKVEWTKSTKRRTS